MCWISRSEAYYLLFSAKNFSYRFVRGRQYALIGHNGCGKSTILEIIRKSKVEDSGKVYFDGTSSDDICVEDYVSLTGVGSHIFKGDFTENVTMFGAYDKEQRLENFDFGGLDFSHNRCVQLTHIDVLLRSDS